MGLDTVQLMMDVEDHFEVDLSDLELENCRSIGDLSRLVLRKLRGSDGGCLTAEWFYALRRAAMLVTSRPKRSFRPGTQLARVTSNEQRRRLWSEFRRSDSRIPALGRTPRQQRLLDALTAVLLTAWASTTAILVAEHDKKGVALGIVLLVLVFGLWEKARRLSLTEIPTGLDTLGSVAQKAATRGPDGGKDVTLTHVVDDIRRITVERADCRFEEIGPQTHFVDLGLD